MCSINISSKNENIETVKEIACLSGLIVQILRSPGNPVATIVRHYENYHDKTAFVAALVGVLVMQDRQAKVRM